MLDTDRMSIICRSAHLVGRPTPLTCVCVVCACAIGAAAASERKSRRGNGLSAGEANLLSPTEGVG